MFLFPSAHECPVFFSIIILYTHTYYYIIIEGERSTIWLESSRIWYRRAVRHDFVVSSSSGSMRIYYHIVFIILYTCIVLLYHILHVYNIIMYRAVCAYVRVHPLCMCALTRRGWNRFFFPFRTSETIRLRTLVSRNPIVGTSCARGLGACVGMLLH